MSRFSRLLATPQNRAPAPQSSQRGVSKTPQQQQQLQQQRARPQQQSQAHAPVQGLSRREAKTPHYEFGVEAAATPFALDDDTGEDDERFLALSQSLKVTTEQLHAAHMEIKRQKHALKVMESTLQQEQQLHRQLQQQARSSVASPGPASRLPLALSDLNVGTSAFDHRVVGWLVRTGVMSSAAAAAEEERRASREAAERKQATTEAAPASDAKPTQAKTPTQPSASSSSSSRAVVHLSLDADSDSDGGDEKEKENGKGRGEEGGEPVEGKEEPPKEKEQEQGQEKGQGQEKEREQGEEQAPSSSSSPSSPTPAEQSPSPPLALAPSPSASASASALDKQGEEEEGEAEEEERGEEAKEGEEEEGEGDNSSVDSGFGDQGVKQLPRDHQREEENRRQLSSFKTPALGGADEEFGDGDDDFEEDGLELIYSKPGVASSAVHIRATDLYMIIVSELTDLRQMLSESGTFLEVYARREHQRALDLFSRRSVYYAHSSHPEGGREDEGEEDGDEDEEEEEREGENRE